MGTFSNGTEGEIYQEQYCLKCINYKDYGCPIWDLHFLWVSDAISARNVEFSKIYVSQNFKDQSPAFTKMFALDFFIPEGNKECEMFIQGDPPGESK